MTVQSYVDDTSEPELSSDARRILVYLVAEMRRGRFLPSDPGSFCGYKETHDALDLKQVRASWGNSLRVQGLQDLVLWIKAKGLPGITGLIGLLRCKVCDWHKPEHGMISGDIVELHHIDPISDAPDDGSTLALASADVSRINQLISNAASQLVRSQISYHGLGSGIKRALEQWPQIEFADDHDESDE